MMVELNVLTARLRKIDVPPFVVGALLYAGLVWLATIFPLAAAGDVNLRPGVVVPIFFGLVFGPWTGFLSGFLGNFLGDIMSGVVVFPVEPITESAWINFAMGTFLPWQIGNGLMGMIPGLLARYGIKRYKTVRDYLLALLFALLGIVVGMGFGSVFTVVLGVLTAEFVFFQYFIPAVWSNTYNTIFLLPIILYNYVNLDPVAFRSFRHGLMRRLLLLILGSAVIPVILFGIFLMQPGTGEVNTDRALLLIKLLFTVILTLLFVIVNASLLAQKITELLLRLADAARLMESGQLSKEQAAKLRTMRGADEISQLCRTFGKMAYETILREEGMRQEIRRLHFKVDRTKTERDVAAITETEYFQQLEEKANQLRALI
jgi:energy-coupling factor transport system substrate-specific component